MKNKGVIIGKIILFLAIIAGVAYGTIYIYNNYLKEDEEETVVIKKLNEIEGYGYTLSDNDTKLYKDEFNALKENLESKEIKYDEYAKSIAKLFAIDLYTIDNKINKYDVGGIEFVYPGCLDNYKLNVENTIYKYVEDNTKGQRSQALPVVKEVKVKEIKETKFKITAEKAEYSAYKINLKLTYHYDLGYDTLIEVIVIKKDNKLYVVEKN